MCVFCEGYNKINMNGYDFDRLIYENDNFYIVPTIGAFVEGYVLIVSKEHICSMGELTNDQYIDFEHIIQATRKTLESAYKMNTIVFEHGTCKENDISSASIVHAHTHVLPIKSSILYKIKEYFGEENIEEVFDIKYIRKYIQNRKSYLYYQDIDNKQYVIKDNYGDSQILRKMAYEEWHKNKWNWRLYPEYNKILKTLQCISKNDIRENLGI